jgi:hypothetical protein
MIAFWTITACTMISLFFHVTFLYNQPVSSFQSLQRLREPNSFPVKMEAAHIPPKYWDKLMILHGVISQKTVVEQNPQ